MGKQVRIMLNNFRETGIVNTGKFAGRTFIEIVRKQDVISVTDKPWCQSHTNCLNDVAPNDTNCDLFVGGEIV